MAPIKAVSLRCPQKMWPQMSRDCFFGLGRCLRRAVVCWSLRCVHWDERGERFTMACPRGRQGSRCSVRPSGSRSVLLGAGVQQATRLSSHLEPRFRSPNEFPCPKQDSSCMSRTWLSGRDDSCEIRKEKHQGRRHIPRVRAVAGAVANAVADARPRASGRREGPEAAENDRVTGQ